MAMAVWAGEGAGPGGRRSWQAAAAQVPPPEVSQRDVVTEPADRSLIESFEQVDIFNIPSPHHTSLVHPTFLPKPD